MNSQRIEERFKLNKETIAALKGQLRGMEQRLRFREEENRAIQVRLQEEIKKGIARKKLEIESRYRAGTDRLESEAKKRIEEIRGLKDL